MSIRTFDNAKFRYRLGDIVLLGNNAIVNVSHPSSPFHDTIGYDYAKTTYRRNRFLDFELLKHLIKVHAGKHQYGVPMPDLLVMHYRAGDWKRVDGHEIEALSSYVKHACDGAQLGKVQIVTAFHYGNSVKADAVDELSKENYRNLNKLTSSIEEMGISVSVKSSGGFDEDFCYLAHANHLLPTKGGFSILAGICNPHHVYPTFPDTTAAILHYAETRPVSLSLTDVLLAFVQRSFGKDPMRKNINPVSRLLEKMKPARIAESVAARTS